MTGRIALEDVIIAIAPAIHQDIMVDEMSLIQALRPILPLTLADAAKGAIQMCADESL